MSDTDADDSGFDKEAERERLREKYGGDSEDRAETERMSELLLQGATMTNRHCGECGNPIFRYEGQAFCSVCEEERPADWQAGGGQPSERVSSAADAEDSTAGARADDSGGTPAEDIPSGGPERREPDPQEHHARPGDSGRPAPERAAPDEVPMPEASPMSADHGRAGDEIDEARVALVRTLSHMARQAETTDEVARVKEYLEAAREAAEALAALDRVRQR